MKSLRHTLTGEALRKCWGVCCICILAIACDAFAINYGAYKLSEITGMLESKQFLRATVCFWVYLGIQIVIPVLELLCNLAQSHVQRTVCLYLRNKISRKIIQHSLSDYGNHSRDYFLQGNTNGVELFNKRCVENIFNCIYFALLLICGLFMLSRLYIWLSVAMAGAIALACLCAHYYDKVFEHLTELYLETEKKYLSAILDMADGFLDAYFTRCRTFFYNFTARHSKEYEIASRKYSSKLKAVGIGFYLPMFLADMFILGIIVYGILVGDTKLDVLAAYLSVGGLLLNSGENLFACMAELKSGVQAIPWEVLAYQKKELTQREENNNSQELRVEKLVFSFNEHDKISIPYFCLSPGEKVIIQSASGTGKSTFFKLITHQIKPDEGTITLNGQNLEEFNEEDIYNQIGYLPQNGHLFEGTLQENVFFNMQISKEFCDEVMERSMLSAFVEQHGLEYHISCNGSNVSGGERQRILLARLFARGKKILLMDEPFANIPHVLRLKIEDDLLREDDLSLILISHDVNDSRKEEYIIKNGNRSWHRP